MMWLLLCCGLAHDPLQPLNEIILGMWNITRVEITRNGHENPDVVEYYTKFEYAGKSGSFTGEFTRVLADKSEQGEHLLWVYVSDNESNFEFRVDDERVVSSTLTKSIDGIMSVHGALASPDVTFSFVVLSSYRAELTVFNRETGEATTWRAMKEFESQKMSTFAKVCSYLATRSLFRAI